eukprot:TRINITY_DN7474_c0_g1_i5.p1 TRINITY_DN7474_c0_g1~~TRINITY_DN7474_c0_g1_i5.p1  ORF type:complete len:402 (-),score=42.59 TRINITY_DN7474_c0_g1_i5:324-1367(-)
MFFVIHKVYVFLHGQPTWGYLWRNVAKYIGGCSNSNYPQLTDACGSEEIEAVGRAILVDHVGFGLSDKPEFKIDSTGKPKFDYLIPSHTDQLAGFIDALGLGIQNGGQKLVLVAHDWGGAIALGYLGRFPENVAGFTCVECVLLPFPLDVIQSTAPFTPDQQISFAQFYQDFVTPMGIKNQFFENKFVEQILPSFILPGNLSPQEHDFYRFPLSVPTKRWGSFWFPQQLVFGEAVYPNGTAIAFNEEISSLDDLPEGTVLPHPRNVWYLMQKGRAQFFNTPLPKLFMTAFPGAIFPTGSPLTNIVIELAQIQNGSLTYVDIGEGSHYVQEDEPDAIGTALRDWHFTF